MFEEISTWLKEHKNKAIIVFIGLAILNFSVWQNIITFHANQKNLQIYFFDVGQGDSGLVILPGGAKVLIDGGPPNGKLLENLGKILPLTDRYIDLVMMSHPQLDHFGGFIDLLERYRVGAFLTNGREGTAQAFQSLKNVLLENKVRQVILRKGDRVLNDKSKFNFLWPTEQFIFSKELNDTSLVAELQSNNSKTLFTGDIGFDVESALAKNYLKKIDILKVAHHGSKYSSSANFLEVTKPTLATIGVGRNSYGHPTEQTIGRLLESGARIYRTDQDGTVKVIIDGEKIKTIKNF